MRHVSIFLAISAGTWLSHWLYGAPDWFLRGWFGMSGALSACVVAFLFDWVE